MLENQTTPHLNEPQRLFKDSVAAFVARESDLTRARQTRREQQGFAPEVWTTMAENGWLGLLYAESYGGLGLSFKEAAVLLEELGRALVPEPVCAVTVLAGGVVAKSDNEFLKQTVLTDIAQGQCTPALAWQERANEYDPSAVCTHTKTSGDGNHRISGQKQFIPAVDSASAFIVSAVGSEGLGLYWVERNASGVEIVTERNVDGVDTGRLILDGAISEYVLCRAGVEKLLAITIDETRLLIAAELVGVMSQALETTLSYVKQREQFGQPIGKFQALQHRLVDLWIQTELSRSSMIRGIQLFEDTDEPGRRAEAASAAKARASDAALLVTRQAIQLHGGIGYTEACDIGLYLKRALNLSSWLGNGSAQRRRFAKLRVQEDKT